MRTVKSVLVIVMLSSGALFAQTAPNAQAEQAAETPNSDPASALEPTLKRLPVGAIIQTEFGGTLTISEPMVVQIIPQTPALSDTDIDPEFVERARGTISCNGLSSNAAAFIDDAQTRAERCGPLGSSPSAYLQGNLLQAADMAILKGLRNAHIDHELSLEDHYDVAQILTEQVFVHAEPKDSVPSLQEQVFGATGPWTFASDATAKSNATGASSRSTTSNYTPTAEASSNVPVSKGATAPQATARTATRRTQATQTQTRQTQTTRRRAGAVPAARNTSQQYAYEDLQYVQVGTFGLASNADKAIAVLAGMGWPVATQKLDRNGKLLNRILAGPFATPAETLRVQAEARAAGYTDAYARP